MTPAQLVTQILQIPTHERSRIVEACAVLAPYMPILEALGGVEAAAAALSVETPTISGRPCDRCGVVIEGRDNRTKFCEGCSREMKRERGLRSNKARDEKVSLSQGFRKATTVEYSCEDCGARTEAPGSCEVCAAARERLIATSSVHPGAPDDPHRWCATCECLIDHRPGRARYCEDCSKTRAQDRPTTAQTRVMKSSGAARDALLALKVGS